MASSFRILTFGCKVNQCDSQILRESLISWGLEEVDTDAADLVIINTCTVTGGADAKFKKALRKIKRESPQTMVAVTGCFAERARVAAERVPEADLIFPSKNLQPLAQFLQERNTLTPDVEGNFCSAEQSYFAEHTRAFLKIQDGCNCFCSYCIVPLVRSALWSRKPEDVLAEVNQLAARGYREVVLTGIHLGFYGRGRGESGLPALLKLLDRNCTIERIRLSSVEVNEVTDDLIELIASSRKLCRHLHLPLQSGDNEILKRMNRRYSVEDFLRKVARIRDSVPDIGITTDVIVGFPGEAEEQFKNTRDIIEQLECARIHAFRYSRRPGTRAATFNSPVAPNVASRRARQLIQTGNDAALRYKRRFIGRTLDVLVEMHDRKHQYLEGYSPNYIRVRAAGNSEDSKNRILPVEVADIDENEGIALGRLSQ